MAGYTRQSTYAASDTILAAHSNNEFDQLVAAFHATTGHKHDGTAAEGTPIPLISDADGDTKIQVEEGPDDDIIRFDVFGSEAAKLTSTEFHLTSTTPRILLEDTDAIADNKKADIRVVNGKIIFRLLSDDEVTTNEWVSLERTGTTATSVELLTDTNLTGRLDVSNIIGNASGSAAAPTYAFSSDTDTGLYRPGVDQLGISAGGVNRLNVGTTSITTSVPVIGINGSVSSPSYGFSSETNTGMYRVSANDIGFAVGGVKSADITSLGIYTKDGTESFPSYSFINGTTTGMYLIPSNSIGFSAGGGKTFELSTTENTTYVDFVVSSTSPLIKIVETDATVDDGKWYLLANGEQLLGQVVSDNELTANTWLTVNRATAAAGAFSIILTATSHVAVSGDLFVSDSGAQFLADASASAASPTYTWNGDTDTGIYRDSLNTIGFSAGGTKRAEINTAAVETTVPIRTSNGSISSPAYSFTGDTNSGMYSAGADNIAFVAGAGNRMDINTLRVNFNLPVYLDVGAVGTPSLTFGADTNTGFYRSGLGEVSVTCLGTRSLLVDVLGVKTAIAGTAVNPSIGFTDDTDTGLYLDLTGVLGVTCGGSKIARFNNTSLMVETTTATARIISDETDYVSGTTTHAEFKEAGVVRGSITSNGTNTAYNTTSDYRLKENVVELTDAVSRIKQLKPSRFNFISNPDTTVDGFIAHEVQSVVPEAVTGEKDGEEMQQMDASKLIPLLTAAIKELEERITALENS